MFYIANLWGLLMVITSTTQWAGWKDQLNSWAAVLSTPCIHGNSSLICGFNHGFQNLSLFMTLPFTLTVNGKHSLGLPDRKELCSSKQLVCSTLISHISIFLLTHQVGDRAGGVGCQNARVYAVLRNGEIILKHAVTSLIRLETYLKRKKVVKENQQPSGWVYVHTGLHFPTVQNIWNHQVTLTNIKSLLYWPPWPNC